MFIKSIKYFFKNPIITIPGILFYLLIGGLSYFGLNPEVIENIMDISTTVDIQSIGPEIVSFFALSMLILLMSLFLTPLVSSWSGLMTRDIVLGHESRFRSSLKNSFTYYWRMFGISILKFLIFLLTCILFGIIIIPLVSSAVNGSSLSITVISTLTVIFILLVVFLWIALMPVEAILIFDALSMAKAFSKGFRFGAKNFFPIFSAIIPFILLMLVLSFILYRYSYAMNLVYAYFEMFFIVYIMNLYSKSSSETVQKVQIQDQSSQHVGDENNV